MKPSNVVIVRVLGQTVEIKKIANPTLRAILASAGENACRGTWDEHDDYYKDWGDLYDDWKGDKNAPDIWS